MTQIKRKKPKPVRQEVILDSLRRRIISGSLLPGNRLPTHQEVQAKFRTTRVTVQRAFDRLAADGFIRTEPKIGRFVADRLPHLTRYGLVFNTHPDPEVPQPWSRFYAAIADASRAVAAQDGISFSLYYNVNDRPDSEGYQSLLRDIDNHRLARVAFATVPHSGLIRAALKKRLNLPVVNACPEEEPTKVMRIPDGRQFLYRAIDMLLAEGRSRFAVITMPQHSYPDELEAAVASRGGITHPSWTHAVEPSHTQWVRHAVNTLLHAQTAELPDCLLITDDHLVEPVAQALEELGVNVPRQLRVIGHWNFPLHYRETIAIDRLGFDAHELVRLWVATIDAQRRGETVKPLVMIPARFAWELPGNSQDQSPAGDPAEIGSSPKERES